MSHSPAPAPTAPDKQQSESDSPFYTSIPTLDVPAIGEGRRPPPVKYMSAATLSLLPRGGADARIGQRPRTRARYDTTSELPRVRDE